MALKSYRGMSEVDIQNILEEGISKGIAIPVWKWSALKPYNGFTHEQRVKVWQAVKVGIELGMLPHPSTLACEICSSHQNLCYHSEDYSVVAPHVVCQRCHRLIHQRYRMPKAWEAHLSRYEREGSWFAGLSSER